MKCKLEKPNEENCGKFRGGGSQSTANRYNLFCRMIRIRINVLYTEGTVLRQPEVKTRGEPGVRGPPRKCT